MARILLVDDEPSIVSVLSTLLRAEGHEVAPCLDGEKAMQTLENEDFDLLISYIRMSPVDGMQLLSHARKSKPEMAVIMITAYGAVETAVEAMKQGAFDYVTKPFKVDELLITVQRALEYNSALTENVKLKEKMEARYHLENIIAESPSMRKVCDMIERVAPTSATVLVQGESGTGKELVAKAIHAYSARKNEPFIAVNCAALPEPLLESEMFGHVKGAFTGAAADKEGLFAAAGKGTILLDEIGSMPLSIQSKLLRVLQEREIRKVGGTSTIKIECRVLASTNDDLDQRIKDGAFREDLYYRLSVIPISIPPLRQRPEDILPLVYHVLRAEKSEGGELPDIEPVAQLALEKYEWPGNVRELENAVRHACAFSKDNTIGFEDFPAKISQGINKEDAVFSSASEAGSYRGKTLKAFLRSKEKDYLMQVLDYMDGDKEKAAKALKISLATLYRKLPDADES